MLTTYFDSGPTALVAGLVVALLVGSLAGFCHRGCRCRGGMAPLRRLDQAILRHLGHDEKEPDQTSVLPPLDMTTQRPLPTDEPQTDSQVARSRLRKQQ